jgi:hypothetical protein
MPDKRAPVVFLAVNFVVWLVMVGILVVVPDQLERWLGLELSRVVGWAVACGVWVVAVERQWQERFGPFMRFALQLVIWVSAALLASWISEQARLE